MLTKLGALSVVVGVTGLAQAHDETSLGAHEAPTIEQGRALFQTAGCAQCHALADAGSSGSYAPSFDGNPHISKEMVRETVTNGRGDMPSFGGLLSDDEIAALAEYISTVAKPPTDAAN